MVQMPQSLAETIIDPSAYADGSRIDAAFAELRRDYPFAVAHPEGYDPFWVVTRHEDLREMERNNSMFLSSIRPAKIATIEAERRFREMNNGEFSAMRTIIQMDPPDISNIAASPRTLFSRQTCESLNSVSGNWRAKPSTGCRHSAANAILPETWRCFTRCRSSWNSSAFPNPTKRACSS